MGFFQLEMFYDSKYKQMEGNIIAEQLHSGNEAQRLFSGTVFTLNSSMLVSRKLLIQAFGKHFPRTWNFFLEYIEFGS